MPKEVTEELEPIDATQCQAEIKEGSFMTFGPRQYIRCKNKPSWIGIDVREGKFYGAMSLCKECKKVCEVRVPSVNFQKLRLPAPDPIFAPGAEVKIRYR